MTSGKMSRLGGTENLPVIDIGSTFTSELENRTCDSKERTV